MKTKNFPNMFILDVREFISTVVRKTKGISFEIQPSLLKKEMSYDGTYQDI